MKEATYTDFEPNQVLDGPGQVSVERNPDCWILRGHGRWTMADAEKLDIQLRAIEAEDYPALRIDTSSVTDFDTLGAWLIERLRASTEGKNLSFEHIDADRRRVELTQVVRPNPTKTFLMTEADEEKPLGLIGKFGEFIADLWRDVFDACYLIGAVIRGPQLKAGKRGGLRLVSVVNQIDKMGWGAVPVITVMSFLIGAVIAQQGAFQLRQFGEELLTVNLVGILHFREIGLLLTSIMVAGRTGSAITAEIGTMKMREEIDALHVIGLNPISVLIFPRLLGLMIVLPVLTLLSDMSGIVGAMVVADLYIDITPSQFISALSSNVDPHHLVVGLIKAPFMAMIIGLVAAVEGLKVGGSAESLGQRTTTAVVRAIFMVILMDGIFAIFFASIGY